MFGVLIFSPVVTFRFPLSRAAVRCFLTSSSFGRWTLGLVPCLMGFSFRYVCSLHSPNSSSPRSSGAIRRSEQPWHHILLSSSCMSPTLWELTVDLLCSWAWDPVQKNPYLSYTRFLPNLPISGCLVCSLHVLLGYSPVKVCHFHSLFALWL